VCVEHRVVRHTVPQLRVEYLMCVCVCVSVCVSVCVYTEGLGHGLWRCRVTVMVVHMFSFSLQYSRQCYV
jgi:hypothetical protein